MAAWQQLTSIPVSQRRRRKRKMHTMQPVLVVPERTISIHTSRDPLQLFQTPISEVSPFSALIFALSIGLLIEHRRN